MNDFQEAAKLRDNGQTDAAIAAYQKLIDTAASDADRAEASQMLGVTYVVARRFDEARESLHAAERLFMALSDQHGLGNTYRDLGLAELAADDYGAAREWMQKSITTLSESGDQGGRAVSLLKLGETYLAQNDAVHAQPSINEALSLLREHTGFFQEVTGLYALARLHLKQADFELALLASQAGIGMLAQAEALSAQGRRLAQLYVVAAHAYFGLGLHERARTYLQSAKALLAGMTAEVRESVANDTLLHDLEVQLKND